MSSWLYIGRLGRHFAEYQVRVQLLEFRDLQHSHFVGRQCQNLHVRLLDADIKVRVTPESGQVGVCNFSTNPTETESWRDNLYLDLTRVARCSGSRSQQDSENLPHLSLSYPLLSNSTILPTLHDDSPSC